MNIYVGNLSFQTTEQGLRAAFGAHGKVSYASIIKDRTTGRPRGFGFLEMPNDSEARTAIQAMNETELDGRILKVDEAREKQDRSRGRSEGRRW